MDFALKMVNYVLKMMNCALKMMNVALKMVNSVLKMMDFALKLMDFDRGAGVDGECPVIPAGWSVEKTVSQCNAACTNSSACLGYTLYFENATVGHSGSAIPSEVRVLRIKMRNFALKLTISH